MTRSDGNTLFFTYDTFGHPATVNWNGTVYYIVTNLQGDVISIRTSAGDVLVWYQYDPWGKILSITGSMATTLGTLNPLTYRGYVHDHETGLYYLQSRYYNPEWGRFLNADALVATGQGMHGNNMFAYCGNNPVNRVDPTGYVFINIAWDFDGLPNSLFPEFGTGFAGGNAVVAATKSDPVYQYVTNTNEQTVINAKYFAFYKGKLAIKLPIKNNAAFYVCMFIGNDVTDETTIRHEYGHSLQWEKRGGLLYTCNIAIPSVIGNIVDRFDKLAYDYYTSPWEAEADQLGGVERQIVGDPWTEEYNSLWAFIKMLLE
jgi:RHS repeat-associated protein